METPESGKIKQRQGCITAYLIFIIIAAAIAILFGVLNIGG